MNKLRPNVLTLLWLALALATLPVLSAQETVPAPQPPSTQPAPVQPPADAPDDEQKPTEPAPEPAADAVTAPEAVTATEEEGEMRELVPSSDSEKPAKSARKSRRTRSYGDASRGDRPPLGSHRVPADATWREAVSVMGSTIVDGKVSNDAVSVMGDTTVNGTVGGAAVAVMGEVTVNGTVDGEVVAVLGDVILGPQAVVRGEVVCILGRVIRADGAQVRGGVQEIGGFSLEGFGWLRTWVSRCLVLGRPLAFGENLGWAWTVAGAFLLFYLLLALLFPRGVERCVENLEQRPGGTFLAAVLAALLTPVLIVLLAITGIGVVLIPFVLAGLFLATLFGKAAILAWFGRRATKPMGGALASSTLLAVLIGGIIVALLYCVPVLGFVLWAFFAVLGMGMVVYTLALTMKSSRPPAPAPVAPAVAPIAPAAPGVAATAPGAAAVVGAVPAAPVPAPGEPAVPPVVNADGSPVVPPVPPPAPVAPMSSSPAFSLVTSTLPRAGFWIRTAAASLDFLLVAVVLGVLSMFHGAGPLFLGLAVYHAVMWKVKGTTIGGIICGLKVVRLDDRPFDWGVAAVRVLSAFLSFFVVGLGFIWVAFDDEKQSWHDKIAGTTIVKVPKGTPLL